MALDKEEQLIFYQGENPVKGYKFAYFDLSMFDGMYDEWDESEDIEDAPDALEEAPPSNEPSEEAAMADDTAPEKESDEAFTSDPSPNPEPKSSDVPRPPQFE